MDPQGAPPDRRAHERDRDRRRASSRRQGDRDAGNPPRRERRARRLRDSRLRPRRLRALRGRADGRRRPFAWELTGNCAYVSDFDYAAATSNRNRAAPLPIASISPRTTKPGACSGRDPFALLVGFALDQQITVQQALPAAADQAARPARSTPKALAGMDLRAGFQGEARRAPLPRLDGEARRGLAATIAEEYDGDKPTNGRKRRTPKTCARGCARWPGFGDMKVRTLADVLANRFGIERARALVPSAAGLGGVDSAAGARRLPGSEARAQGGHQSRRMRARTLTDGGQTCSGHRARARRLRERSAALARHRDLRREASRPARGDRPLGAHGRSEARRAVRLAYNLDDDDRVPVPPPPSTNPGLLESLPFRRRRSGGFPT